LFPDENAIKILIPIAVILKYIFKTKIYYNVIGGWLPDFLKKNKYMQSCLKKLDGIFVQTTTLKNELAGFNINKVYIFPNFKNIKIFKEDELLSNNDLPLRICFMSRITEQKGVEEMIRVIKHINRNKVKYILDIYGPVSDEYKQRFAELEKDFPSYIRFKGVVEPLKTSDMLKNYFLQLFPTKYRTEGFPGSILDSFCAGVPVADLGNGGASEADVFPRCQTIRDARRCKSEFLSAAFQYSGDDGVRRQSTADAESFASDYVWRFGDCHRNFVAGLSLHRSSVASSA
jgi:glycosyltransferase involved in cell wall biosynthesis